MKCIHIAMCLPVLARGLYIYYGYTNKMHTTNMQILVMRLAY